MSKSIATLILGITYKNHKTNQLVSIQGFPELLIGDEWVGGVSYIDITKVGKTSVREFGNFVSNFQIVRKKTKKTEMEYIREIRDSIKSVGRAQTRAIYDDINSPSQQLQSAIEVSLR